jgi:hypothetical protein
LIGDSDSHDHFDLDLDAAFDLDADLDLGHVVGLVSVGFFCVITSSRD